MSTAKNNRGQMTIEAVLTMVALFSIFVVVIKGLNEGNFLKKLIRNPWNQLAGMIENGSWGTPEETREDNPFGFKRVQTPIGESP